MNNMFDGKDGGDIRRILAETEISLVLDTYEDIFSDFDPRPFNERSLSEDFLLEAKRAARDKGEGIEVRFLIPRAHKNIAHEALIKQRLREHFRKHHTRALGSIKAYKRQAVFLICIGTLIGFAAVWLSLLEINNVLKHAVEILLSPASWFTIWTGFEHLTFLPEQHLEDEKFYRKMIDAHITFTTY
jgi:hypothetical protein